MLRSEKIEQINGANAAKYAKIIAELYMYDVTFKMRKHAYDAANSFLKDDELKSILATIDMLTDFKPVNIRESHRFLADKIIEENNYCF